MKEKNRPSIQVPAACAGSASFTLVSLLSLFLFFFLPDGSIGAEALSAKKNLNLSGRWNSDYGILHLTQKEKRVDGTYSCCNGSIAGTIRENRLDFTWNDPMYGQGWGFFIFQHNGDKFTGKWGMKKDIALGQWNGTRIRGEKAKEALDAGSTISPGRGEELLRKAMDLQQNGEYGEAAALFKEARAHFVLSANTAKIDSADIGLALCAAVLGQYEDARRLYREILDRTDNETTRLLAKSGLAMVAVELGGEGDLYGAVPELTEPDDPIELRMKGFALLQEGKFQEGMEALERALAGYRSLNSAPGISRNMHDSNLISQGNIHMAMSHGCYKEKEYPGAIRQAENALNIWLQLQSEPNIAQAYTSLGIFNQKLKNFNLSLQYFNKAAAIQKITGLPEIWQTFYFLAMLHDETGSLRPAETFFEQSIAAIENLRADLRTDEAKIGFFSLKTAPFEDFITFLLERKPGGSSVEQALEVTERARARALTELLAKKTPSSAPASELASYYGETFDEWFSPLHITPPKADEIVHFIQQGETAYIVYFVTDPKTYSWLLLPSGEIYLETINLSKKQLTETVENIRTDIHDGLDQGSSRILFDALLKPLLTRLQSRMSSCRQLTIIPHDILNNLSFDVLSDNQVYPLLEYTITYLPALAIAEQFKPVRLNPDDRILLVGNPRGAKLESAEEEVLRVAGIFPNHRKLTGKIADKETIISEINKAYDAVLFSTHGKPDLESPQLSHLLLADGDKLTLKDITRLKLNTKLVVMSACETHIGKRFGGDELMALTRGVLASGCENVLTTLWPVEQDSASRIVINFFENLNAGLSPAQSLRRSQVRYLEDKNIKAKQKRPYYWAPFLVIGSNL